MHTLDYLIDFYENKCDEDARLTSRHGSVEYLTTMRYIDKYLTPSARIIEIGAGTGRYSHTLAKRGYKVDAVELLDHNIDVFKSHITPDEPVTVTKGNALDLSGFPDEAYDITLLLGPMYHLYTVKDQSKALSEAIRVTKKGGVVFAAYCNNDATMVEFCFGKGKILEEHYQKMIDHNTFKASSTPAELFQLYRKEDVDSLMSSFHTSRLHYVGTDMATHFMPDTVDAMSDELFEAYLRYHFFICERPDMVGATHHMLDIFRKD